MKKKILYISGYPHIIGGSQRQLITLIKGVSTSYNITVFTNLDGVLVDFLKKDNISTKVIHLPNGLNHFGKKLIQISWFRRIYLIPSYVLYTVKLLYFLRTQRFDIIQCIDIRSVLLTGLASIISRTPILWYIQTQNTIGNFYWKLGLFFSKYIVYNGQFAMSYLEGSIKKTKLIYSVSQLEKPQICSPNSSWLASLKERNTIIGVFSSITPGKGYHHLLDTIAAINKDIENIIVFCVGSLLEEQKIYLNWLDQKIKNKSIDNVTFTGWQSNPYTFINLCDIIVLPSVLEETLTIGNQKTKISGGEGLPTIILEAMELGKPVIATDVGSVYEQVEDTKTGFIIPPSNSKILIEKLIILIKNKALRERMGKEAKLKFENKFSKAKFIQLFTDFYEEIFED